MVGLEQGKSDSAKGNATGFGGSSEFGPNLKNR